MSERVLDVENLSIKIPVIGGMLHAVDNISLHVERGETLCIVGESGCGKSLTSLAIMDLLPKKAIRTVDKMSLSDADILNFSEKQMSNVRGNKIGNGPVLVEFIVEQHDMVYPMVATGADLNDMISRPVHDQFQESEM